MSVRRRRECEKVRCGYRFSTVEEAELLDVSIVKRDGRREPYLQEKLIGGMSQSLQKRPCTDVQMKNLVRKIEKDIQKRRSGEITTVDLGEIVMKHLRKFDKVAYIRFASIYYSFEDLERFEKELRKVGRRRVKS